MRETLELLLSEVSHLVEASDAPARDLDDASLLARLSSAGRIRRLTDALGVALSAEVAARSARSAEEPLAKRMGERSATDLVSRSAGVEPTEAGAWCSLGPLVTPRATLLGEVLESERPFAAAALSSGELTVGAALAVTRSVAAIENRAEVGTVHEVEQFLVSEATRLTARQVGRLGELVRDRLDPDGTAPREDDLRRRAGIRETRSADGHIRWIVDMDPETAGMLIAAVDAKTDPRRLPRFVDESQEADVERDERTHAQRRLDGLLEVARASLKADPGVAGGTAVTMLVTVPYEVLRDGVGDATICGVDASISAATARRLAVEADIIPVVLGGSSEILDVGRRRRLHTRAQRYAMAVRDGGCVWPGCEAPPNRCEAAHAITPWSQQGTTDLANGALLCRFHHRRLDNDGWLLRIRDDVPYLIPPPWVDPARRPRRGGRARVPRELQHTG